MVLAAWAGCGWGGPEGASGRAAHLLVRQVRVLALMRHERGAEPSAPKRCLLELFRLHSPS